MKVIQKCPNCGKEFETSIKSGKIAKTYCCSECFKHHKGIGITKMLKCEICGNEFQYVHGKGTKTCSKECTSRLKSILFSIPKNELPSTICLCCGKEIKYEKYKSLHENLIPKFCNNKCYFEYLKTHSKEVFNHSKQIDESHEYRKCEICGNEFYTYKKSKKRFCSNECRVKYQMTNEFKEKKNSTMMEKYGAKSVGGDKNLSLRYFKERNEKYTQLCEKSDLELLEYVSKYVLKVKCKKCGNEFITNNLSYIQYDHIPCKHCSNEYKDYKPALKIYQLLNENNIEYIKNDRNLIHPYELDVYIPNFNLALEINGNFWHSELCGKDKEYHIRKTKMCNEKGVKLIHIFEDEIEYKWNIVKSRICNLLRLNRDKIYARKCNIILLRKNDKSEFLNKTHIQGDGNSSINLGLVYNDEIVSVMTFSNERVIYNGKKDDTKYELIRFSNKLNTNVVGSFSKLLKYFIKNYHPSEIKTFADSRWSGVDFLNTVYIKNGFEFVQQTSPNYWYMYKLDYLDRKHRYNFTKHKILEKNPDLDSSKTEWQLMQELGYNRIWDCGSMKFVLK